jgi:hypothetical protein
VTAPAPGNGYSLGDAVTDLLDVAKLAVEAAQQGRAGDRAELSATVAELASHLDGIAADLGEEVTDLAQVRDEVEAACLAIVRAEDVTDEDVEAGYAVAIDVEDWTGSSPEVVRALLQSDRARVADRVVCPDGDPSTLAGRARVAADLIDQVGNSAVWSLDVTSHKRYVNSRTGRAQVEATLNVRNLDGVQAVAEVLGRGVETTPWEVGEPGRLHHAVSADWRGVQIEAYTIVEPREAAGQAETGAGR